MSANSLTLRIHADYTVGWICALSVELAAARAMLDEEHPSLHIPPNDGNTYILGSISGHNVVIACLPLGVYGLISATVVAISMKSTFPNSTTMPLLVGIAGGVPTVENDMRLGDVVISTPSSNYPAVLQYDFGKTTGSGHVESRSSLSKPAHVLLTAVGVFRVQQDLRRKGIARHIWKALDSDSAREFQHPGAEADILYKAGCDHLLDGPACKECGSRIVERSPRETRNPRIHYGVIGSGNQVIKHAATRDKLSTRNGNILCFEMEAAGVMDYVPCLVIRGICDYADAFKTKDFQGFAAVCAAAVAKELLVSIQPRLSVENSSRPAAMTKQLPTLADFMEILKFAQSSDRRVTVKNAHPQTCAWILAKEEYVQWEDRRHLKGHSGLLWIKGKPGTGKSTIMKFLLDYHERKRGNVSSMTIIHFFFNARGHELTRSTIGMYRSLLYQLLEQIPDAYDLFTDIQLMDFQKHVAEVTYLETLFKRLIVHFSSRRILCLIDALDECPEEEVQDMVDIFEELGQMAGLCQFQILFSSRHYPNVSNEIGLKLILEDETGHDDDIINYINAELHIGDGDQSQQLKRSISQKSNGIFLWIFLVVRILRRELRRGNVHGLEKVLADIPQDLNTLLSDIIARVTSNQSDFILCMQWVLYAVRPLKKEELYFALLSCPGSSISWPTSEISTEMMNNYILHCSRGLVEFTRTAFPEAQFIHESVRELLLNPQRIKKAPKCLSELDADSSQHVLALGCNRYLQSDSIYLDKTTAIYEHKTVDDPDSIFRQYGPWLSRRYPFLQYAVQGVLDHVEKAMRSHRLDETFFEDFDEARWISLIRASSVHARSGLWYFDQKRPPEQSRLWTFEKALVIQEKYFLLAVWLSRWSAQDLSNFESLLCWLVELQDWKACLVVHRIFKLITKASVSCAPFGIGHAFSSLNIDTAPQTEQSGTPHDDMLPTTGVDSFSAVIPNKTSSAVSRHLHKLTNISTIFTELKGRWQDDTFQPRSVLHSDAWEFDILYELLVKLKRGRSTDILPVDKRDNLRLSFNRLLLGLSFRYDDPDMDDILKYAALCKDKNALVILLQRWPPLKRPTPSLWMYVVCMPENAHQALKTMACLDYLISIDVRCDSRNRWGLTPLHAAAIWATEPLLAFLQQRCLAINTRCRKRHYTPLHYAIKANNCDGAKFLASTGAGLDLIDMEGNTPLHLAVEVGSEALVSILLEAGADPHRRNINGEAPFFLAVKSENMIISKKLLDAGANIEEMNDAGETALEYAERHCSDAMAEMLAVASLKHCQSLLTSVKDSALTPHVLALQLKLESIRR